MGVRPRRSTRPDVGIIHISEHDQRGDGFSGDRLPYSRRSSDALPHPTRWRCNSLERRQQITATQFERSHIPAHRVIAGRVQASLIEEGHQCEMHSMLGMMYKPAWFMMLRIMASSPLRSARKEGPPRSDPLDGLPCTAYTGVCVYTREFALMEIQRGHRL